MIAVIEIPKGSQYKYEIKDRVLTLDRVLNQKIPSNYGFIEGLPLRPDGDALDVFILSRDPIVSMALVEIEIKGIFYCIDGGVQDDKVVAVIKGDNYLQDDWSFPLHEINEYLRTYKENFVVTGYDQIDQLSAEYL